jgi:hypothetical protein
MKLAIVGSRTVSDLQLVYDEADEIHAVTPVTELISGGAQGADSLGESWAKSRGIPIRHLIPDWKKHGRGAGIMRNTDIVKQADQVIAFWDGTSRGTQDTMRKAKKASKLVKVVQTLS